MRIDTNAERRKLRAKKLRKHSAHPIAHADAALLLRAAPRGETHVVIADGFDGLRRVILEAMSLGRAEVDFDKARMFGAAPVIYERSARGTWRRVK